MCLGHENEYMEYILKKWISMDHHFGICYIIRMII